MKPFIPNETESRLIRERGVAPERLAYWREFCTARGMDYNRFLRVNETFMNVMGIGEDEEHDGTHG